MANCRKCRISLVSLLIVILISAVLFTACSSKTSKSQTNSNNTTIITNDSNQSAIEEITTEYVPELEAPEEITKRDLIQGEQISDENAPILPNN